MPLAILGTGGHAKSIFDIVKDKTNSVKSIQRESPLIQFFYA